MTDDTRRMVEEALAKTVCDCPPDYTRCAKPSKHGIKAAVKAIVALVEKERGTAADYGRSMDQAIERAEAAEKTLAEARGRWGHAIGCGCHDEISTDEDAPDGGADNVWCYSCDGWGNQRPHPVVDPRCAPPPAAFNVRVDPSMPDDEVRIESGRDSVTIKVQPPAAEPTHIHGTAEPCAACRAELKAVIEPTPERCGTCGSDDPATRYFLPANWPGPNYACPAAFHSQPPAGKETR